MQIASSKGGEEQSPFPPAAALLESGSPNSSGGGRRNGHFPGHPCLQFCPWPRAPPGTGGRCCLSTCPPRLRAGDGEGGQEGVQLRVRLLLYSRLSSLAQRAGSDHVLVQHCLEINLNGTRINKIKPFFTWQNQFLTCHVQFSFG